jgi:hypothetical protein
MRGVARQRRAGPSEIRQKGQLELLTQPQVQRYAVDSGLRDIMIAEKDVVLTFSFSCYQSTAS